MPANPSRRYARHLVLPEIGEAGQARLSTASVLVVGVGGLGNIAAAYLAAMGIGRLGLVDSDRIELSNLQRQVLYETADEGRLKVEAARDALLELAPEARIETHALTLDASNAASLIQAYDLVLDGTDTFDTRFILHDACLRAGKTLVSAAVIGFEGQLSTFKAHQGPPHPCYRCFVPEAPPEARTCRMAGVLGAAAGVMGSLQAVEAVKELLGIGQSLSGRVLLYDALAGTFRTVLLQRDTECSTCAAFSPSSAASAS